MKRCTVDEYWDQLDSVDGWVTRTDFRALDALLEWQERTTPPGDLVELGAYKGKSAILIGLHQRADEVFTVCDLFGDTAESAATRQHNDAWYGSWARDAFEKQYLRFHTELPKVVHGPSSTILDNVSSRGNVRLLHIDASGIYGDARTDYASAQTLLRSDGVVVSTGWRAEHFYGATAALWESVFTTGLKPIGASSFNFYSTWADPEPAQKALLNYAKAHPDFLLESEEILGAPFLRMRTRAPHVRDLTRAERLAKEVLPNGITSRLGERRRRRTDQRANR